MTPGTNRQQSKRNPGDGLTVSAIVVSYNTVQLTLQCLKALADSRGVTPEIILIDNNSTDGTVKEIRKQKSLKGIKIIENRSNQGFGKANNQGMKIARGEYLILVNSDCFVRPDTICNTLEFMERNPRADVAGCRLENSDGSLQSSWGHFPTLRRVLQLMLFVDNLPGIRKFCDSIYVRDASRYKASHEADWIMGAYMMLNREVYEKTGGFDEHFFMYGEEVEWQMRIKKHGYGVWYTPGAAATHLGGASWSGKDRVFIGGMRGFIQMYKIHNPSRVRMLEAILILGCLIRIPAWWVMGRVMGKPGLWRDYLKILPELTGEIFGRSK